MDEVRADRPRDVGRRRFLRRSGLAVVSAGIGVAVPACRDDERALVDPGAPPAPPPDLACARTFFSAAQAAFVDAMTSRILPGSPDDPGAREAGVVRYIDCLLGASDGDGRPTYRQPPFPAPDDDDLAPLRADPSLDLPPVVSGGAPDEPAEMPAPLEPEELRDDSIEATGFGVVPIPRSQFDRYGYQSLLTNRELYQRGIAATDDHARSRFGRRFVELTEDEQDLVVEDLANDAADGFDVPSAEGFFELVRRHTIEGMFADPMYGGNRDMVGWRLIGYPGAQRAYTPDEVRTPGFGREPQSLADLHTFNPGLPDDHHDPTLPVSGP